MALIHTVNIDFGTEINGRCAIGHLRTAEERITFSVNGQDIGAGTIMFDWDSLWIEWDRGTNFEHPQAMADASSALQQHPNFYAPGGF